MHTDVVEVADGTVVRTQPLLASGTCAVHFNAETAQQKKEGLFLTLRLVDGPNGTPTGWGLAPKNGCTFDHPNGSGLECHNIDIEVCKEDGAARVRLDGPADRCTLLLEERGAGLHVSWGPPGPNVEGSHVIFHSNKQREDASWRPAGDRWRWDRKLGTLSPCANEALTLGHLDPGVGLVPRNHPKVFRFAEPTADVEAPPPVIGIPLEAVSLIAEPEMHAIEGKGKAPMTIVAQVDDVSNPIPNANTEG